MTIPFRVKLLTETAKLPHRNCESDLWDLFADDFCIEHLKDISSKEIIDGEFDNYFFGGNVEEFINVSNVGDQHLKDELSEAILTREISGGRNNYDGSVELSPQSRILVKTGIAIELPIDYGVMNKQWYFENEWDNARNNKIESYAVADIRPRSGLALKHGITVLNTPGTIDNSYRKEIGVILYNAGHEPYTIKKGDKIAQMLIRPLYPSSFEVVEDFGDTGRGGFGSTGK